jgi:hypothetical protein
MQFKRAAGFAVCIHQKTIGKLRRFLPGRSAIPLHSPPQYIHESQTVLQNKENGMIETDSCRTDDYQPVSFFPQMTDPERLANAAGDHHRAGLEKRDVGA